MSSKNKNTIAGIFLVGLLLGGIILLARRPERAESSPIYLNRGVSSKVKTFPIVDFTHEPGRKTKHYQNTETWDIEWNEDGLPKKVKIHRDAVQT